jgi:uncharacterized membrane protein (UPF0127 family)
MPSFLSPLLQTTPAGFRLVNTRTEAAVADVLMTAFDSASRTTGLLRHHSLPVGSALIIAPTSAIHTWFMKFSLDVLFVARDGRVLKACEDLRPWRMAIRFGAFAVVEMTAGALQASGTRVGDRIAIAAK